MVCGVHCIVCILDVLKNKHEITLSHTVSIKSGARKRFKMSLIVLRLCPRFVFAILKNSISSSRSGFPTALQYQRFCHSNILFGDKIENEIESFDDFEEERTVDEFLSSIDFDAIVGNDVKEKKELQQLALELDMQMRLQNLIAPKHLTPAQWRKLLLMKHRKPRMIYLHRLYFKEKEKEKKVLLGQERRKDYIMFQTEKEKMPPKSWATNSPITYSLGNNTLFHRIYPTCMKKKYNFNIAMSTIFGPDLLVDCSYEDYMRIDENYACARQILYMWSDNRGSKNPFNLIFCNLNPNGQLNRNLHKLFQLYGEKDFMLNLTEKSYKDLYSTDQLIYLTPHCEEELNEYDGNSVYIIGAYVDEKINKPVSIEIAKRDGLRTAKFPLDRHLNWCRGSKLLPINQCMNIMSDLKDGSNWQYALRHVALRKQNFQIFETKPRRNVENPKLAAVYVRESAQRAMLRDLNIKKSYRKKEEDSPSSSPDL